MSLYHHEGYLPVGVVFTGGLFSTKKIMHQFAIVFHSEFENLHGPLNTILDGLVKSLQRVIPAQARICNASKSMDFRFRGNDKKLLLRLFTKPSILVFCIAYQIDQSLTNFNKTGNSIFEKSQNKITYAICEVSMSVKVRGFLH